MKLIPDLVSDYVSWLRDKTQVRELTHGWHEITTPFIDHHNDMIQIYARRTDDGITITDDGYAISDLADAGCDVDGSPKRKALLGSTLAGFGVQRVGNSLQVTASDADFASKKHALLQSMLAVSDMFMLAQANVVSMFVEDVYGWLDANDIRYTPQAKFSGMTGFDHVFEAVIPKSRNAPERLLKTIANPTKDRVQSAIFAWTDTRNARPEGAQLYAVVNDERKVVPNMLDAFTAYNIKPMFWSARDQYIEALAA
ncbi:MAG TPA: DUF1828 domain-containing protein [Devosia sp.]|nr:DUF1828 domain-containing protein [Devosia sp.]